MMPADSTSPTYHRLLGAFVQELVRCGMRDACTSPGSRSTPLVLALTASPALRTHSLIDERVGGFFALGAAKSTGLPVALACTSGTAAVELAPAVVEAHEARVPLLVLTADRPPELRRVGAGQTIDQLALYGTAAKWFFEVGVHDWTAERERWMRALACRAYWTTIEGRPGPVHLNFPLPEPLVPPSAVGVEYGNGRGREPRPWVTRKRGSRVLGSAELEELRELLRSSAHPVIVAGREESPGSAAEDLARFAHAAGAPLLADPLSGARRGPAAIAHYDALLRHRPFADAHRPDLVVRFGDLPTSKALRGWLGALPDSVPQVAVDPDGAWQDPSSSLLLSLDADPAGVIAHLGDPLGGTAEAVHLEGWRGADAAAARAIASVLAAEGDAPTEPGVASALGAALSGSSTLVVAASMPIRDVETFFPAREDPPRVLANRGANGIDGSIATALGVAATSEHPVLALLGDVALTHDAGALLALRRRPLPLVMVALNNGGGAIFDFLPVASAPLARTAYEEHIATPPHVDLAALAKAAAIEHHLLESIGDLRAALTSALAARRAALLEVRTDRAANVALHGRIWEAVASAVG